MLKRDFHSWGLSYYTDRIGRVVFFRCLGWRFVFCFYISFAFALVRASNTALLPLLILRDVLLHGHSGDTEKKNHWVLFFLFLNSCFFPPLHVVILDKSLSTLSTLLRYLWLE